MHPKYLDAQGLVALWREALLAKAVLRGATHGYQKHPQLQRFRAQPAPVAAIDLYLSAVHAEAQARGYSFDRSKIGDILPQPKITLACGQLAYEWQHLLGKLAARNRPLYERWRQTVNPDCHPLFAVFPGPVAGWEGRHLQQRGDVLAAPRTRERA